MKPAGLLEKIRSICLRLPEAKEEIKWGHPVFVAGRKMFAGFGDHDGVATIGFKVPDDRFDSLVESGRFFPAPYAARFNWVSLHLREPIDWRELETLLVGSYRLVALKRMLAELDAKPAIRNPAKRARHINNNHYGP
jgi:predicted DNA-binding protein (MmcQ/YjbR family)